MYPIDVSVCVRARARAHVHAHTERERNLFRSWLMRLWWLASLKSVVQASSLKTQAGFYVLLSGDQISSSSGKLSLHSKV